MSIQPAVPSSKAHVNEANVSKANGLERAAKLFAVLRVSLGFIFLWAALDKTFGWNYSTVGEKAWVNGGSPTKDFLGSIDQGPLASVFTEMAGRTWVDVLFIFGLLAVGVALIAGVAMRLAALGSTIIMVLMWLAEWPLAQATNAGEPTGSTNPFMDYHLIYALATIALVFVAAGRTWGLGPGQRLGAAADRPRPEVDALIPTAGPRTGPWTLPATRVLEQTHQTRSTSGRSNRP
jgi:thiosulfate dehydrogenase (quinone) large subunit